MKVLMLSYYYPPHSAIGATRAYLVSKYLAKRGHDVTVIAAKPQPGGIDTSKFPDYDNPGGLVKVLRTGRVERVMDAVKKGVFKAAGSNATSGGTNYQQQVTEASQRSRESGWMGDLKARVLHIARSDLVPEREVTWNPEATALALQQIRKERPDVIYVCARPFVSFYVGATLKRLTGIPLVLDLRDPWSLLPHHDALTRSILQPQERALFAQADRILINTHTSRARYDALYPESITRKMRCAPNAMSQWPAEGVFDGFEGVPPLRLIHGGNLYRRSITPLLKAFQQFVGERTPEASKTWIRQVGRIDIDTFDPAVVESLGDYMQIHPFLPFEAFQRHVQEATVQIVLLGPEHYLRIPAKFYECLASGKAILFLGPEDHEVVDVLENQTGVGVGANAGSVESLHRALVRLQDEVLPRLAKGHDARKALHRFHIETRAEEIERYLEEAIRGN